MDRSKWSALLVILSLLLVGLGTTRAAVADPGEVRLVPSPGAAQAVARTAPQLIEAVQRDLRLTRDEVITRVGRQLWGVDPARNRVVVAAADQGAAAKWVADAGVPADLVTYDRSVRPAKPVADRLGGDPISGPRGQCTEGFGVRPLSGGLNGFVTAGHCAFRRDLIGLELSAPLLGTGTTAKSTFPPPGQGTPDEAFVQLNSPVDQVLAAVRSDGLTIPVVGSQAAMLGEVVCSYGRVTKYQCGRLSVIARDIRVDYRGLQGVNRIITVPEVNGVQVCVSSGDSGGPVITPFTGQAQGTIVSVSCDPPALISYYEPINQSQRDLDVRLLFAGAAPSGPPPVITAFSCDVADGPPGPDGPPYSSFECALYWEGGTDPDQVQISSNGLSARRINHYDENYVYLSGKCGRDVNVYITAQVFDAEGRHDDATRNSFCPG